MIQENEMSQKIFPSLCNKTMKSSCFQPGIREDFICDQTASFTPSKSSPVRQRVCSTTSPSNNEDMQDNEEIFDCFHLDKSTSSSEAGKVGTDSFQEISKRTQQRSHKIG